MSHMHRMAQPAAALLAGAVALAGCSVAADEAGNGQTTTATPPADESPVATYPGIRVGMDAALESTLQFVDDCVVVGGAEGPYTVIAFLEEGGATWNDGVLTWDGNDYRVGERVQFGGGAGTGHFSHLPEGCVGLPSFLVGS